MAEFTPGLMGETEGMETSRTGNGPPPFVYRFGTGEFDPSLLTLSIKGERVSLQNVPALILATLLSNKPKVVTYDDLWKTVWGRQRPLTKTACELPSAGCAAH